MLLTVIDGGRLLRAGMGPEGGRGTVEPMHTIDTSIVTGLLAATLGVCMTFTVRNPRRNSDNTTHLKYLVCIAFFHILLFDLGSTFDM